METSDHINELAAALAKAQAEMKPAEMTATNPFLKNKYADLGENIKATKEPLSKYGLSLVQPVSGDGTQITVTTMLMHSSGQWIRETVSLPLGEERGKSLAQAAGSVITYLRRYSLAAMIGLYADEDTDGNDPKPAANRQQRPVGSEAPSDIQVVTRTAPTNGNGNKPTAQVEVEASEMTPKMSDLRMQPEALKDALAAKAKNMTGKVTPAQKGLIASTLEAALGTPDPKAARKQMLRYLTGHDSLTELNDAMLLSLHAWLKPYQEPASGEWFCDDMAAREARAALIACQPPQAGLFS